MYYKNDKVDGWKIQIKDRFLRYKNADLIDSFEILSVLEDKEDRTKMNFTFILMFPLNCITNTIRLDPVNYIDGECKFDATLNKVAWYSENKNNQISTCSSCNIQNEYIDYDPNYICLKCKNNW